MRKHVIIASNSAISITIFFRANPPVFLKSSLFTADIIALPFQNRMRFSGFFALYLHFVAEVVLYSCSCVDARISYVFYEKGQRNIRKKDKN